MKIIDNIKLVFEKIKNSKAYKIWIKINGFIKSHILPIFYEIMGLIGIFNLIKPILFKVKRKNINKIEK